MPRGPNPKLYDPELSPGLSKPLRFSSESSPLVASLFVNVEHAFGGVHNTCFGMSHAILHQILRLFLHGGGVDDAIVAHAAVVADQPDRNRS
jgi:hypothetical protein